MFFKRSVTGVLDNNKEITLKTNNLYLVKKEKYGYEKLMFLYIKGDTLEFHNIYTRERVKIDCINIDDIIEVK